MGQLCSQKYKWFQFITAPFVLYLPFPWEGPSALFCQDLGIALGFHVIPVLLVVLVDLCGRGEAQHTSGCDVCPTEHLLHLGSITSFSRRIPAGPGQQQRSLGVSPCWQVSWLCWAPSSIHLLPGVPRVMEALPWHSCLLCWSVGSICEDSAEGSSAP